MWRNGWQRRMLWAVLPAVLGGCAALEDSVPYRGAIVAAEQRTTRILLLDPQRDWDCDAAVLWQWEPLAAPEIKPEHRQWFHAVSECKPVSGGTQLLVAASGGGVALVDLADGGTRFYGYAGGNTHSAALLPDGNIVSASSTGNFLCIFVVDSFADGEGRTIKIDYPDAHGVVWDRRRQMLWALGREALTGFRYNFDKGNPQLTAEVSYPLPGGVVYGHDLWPVLGEDRLYITDHDKVSVFDPETGSITLFRQQPDVKSISRAADGRIIVTLPREEWWTDRVTLLDSGESVGLLPGARFYKARWWEPDSFEQ